MQTTTCDNPRGYKSSRHLCDCDACRRALIRERTRSVMRVSAGRARKLVPADKTRERLRRLDRLGVPVWCIAEAAGITTMQVHVIRRGETARVTQTVAAGIRQLHDKLVGRDKSKLRPRAAAKNLPRRSDYVSIDKTSRAIRGLMRQGYPQTLIAERIGSRQRNVSIWAQAQREYVLRENEDAVMRLVREVGVAPGPSAASALYAERQGWFGLANWDDLL